MTVRTSEEFRSILDRIAGIIFFNYYCCYYYFSFRDIVDFESDIIEPRPISSSSSKYFQLDSLRIPSSSSSSFIHNGARSCASRSERTSIYARAHTHVCAVDGSHSTPHYFLARSVDQQKEAPLKRYLILSPPPPSPSRRSSIFSPRFFCSSFPDGPLINSIHQRRFQLDRVARTRGDIPPLLLV